MTDATALFRVGDRYEHRLTATAQMMAQFRAISGDDNPVHHDQAFAAAHGFRGPIVYGNFLGMMVSRLIGVVLPTPKVVILRQSLDFRRPAYIGEELRLRAEVAAVHEAVQSVQLKLTFDSSSTESFCTGVCLIKCL